MPLAAYATLDQDVLVLDAAWGDIDGKLALVRVRQQALVTDLSGAAALGQRVAQALQAQVLAQGGSLAHLALSDSAP